MRSQVGQVLALGWRTQLAIPPFTLTHPQTEAIPRLAALSLHHVFLPACLTYKSFLSRQCNSHSKKKNLGGSIMYVRVASALFHVMLNPQPPSSSS